MIWPVVRKRPISVLGRCSSTVENQRPSVKRFPPFTIGPRGKSRGNGLASLTDVMHIPEQRTTFSPGATETVIWASATWSWPREQSAQSVPSTRSVEIISSASGASEEPRRGAVRGLRSCTSVCRPSSKCGANCRIWKNPSSHSVVFLPTWPWPPSSWSEPDTDWPNSYPGGMLS